MTKDEIRNLLVKQTKSIPVIDVDLMCAIIDVESSGNPWAVRYEPSYPYLKDPAVYSTKNMISLDTEKTLQRMSWGLFQIMGCAARELGFQDNLTKLLIPEVNMIWGIEFFRVRCKARFNKVEDQIAAYNAGTPKKDKNGIYTNGIYVGKVLSAYHQQDQDSKSALLA